MRFFVRSLSLVFLAVLLAMAAAAQDLAPVALHPSSRSWLNDTAAIVVENDSPQTIDAVRQAIESVDGTLVLYAPPGVLIAQVPDGGIDSLALTEGVRFITKSPFEPANLAITDPNAVMAIKYFNWVASGRADADLDRPTETTSEFAAQIDIAPRPPSAMGKMGALDSPPLTDHRVLGTSVLVNLIFINGPNSTWNDNDKSAAYNNAATALSWWNSRLLQHFGTSRPVTGSFYMIRSYTYTQAFEPGEANTANQWVNATMEKACQDNATGTCSWFDPSAYGSPDYYYQNEHNVHAWNGVTRAAAGTADAFTGFLVHKAVTIGNETFGGYLQFLGGSWWAIGTAAYGSDGPGVIAHETGHVYWACDEYSSNGAARSCSPCGGPSGASNGNAENPTGSGCALHRHPVCVMTNHTSSALALLGNDLDTEYDKVCPWTREQIGWVSPACFTDVNWNLGGTTHWEGQYFSDSHAPRMPLVHWAGVPQLTRDDGSANSLDFDFAANPITGTCLSSTGSRSTDFSVRWRRRISFLQGTYEFHGTGDDVVRIYVDGLELKPSATSGTFEKIDLSAGTHTVQVDYYQTSGAASVHVDWTKIETFVCPPAYDVYVTPKTGTDLCPGEPVQLQVDIRGGTGPYRIAIQRNNDLPVTYNAPFRLSTVTPTSILGDSTYKVISVVDANGCPGRVVVGTAKFNIDMNTPRLDGGIRGGLPTGCSYPISWDAARSCTGAPLFYTLTRTQFTAAGPVTNTLINCSQTALSYVDNDVHAGTQYQYVVTVAQSDCATGGKRSYLPATLTVNSCPTTPSSISTSSLTATYGDHPVLSAHLTGNSSAIPNRTVTFELNGVVAATGVTDSSGDASAMVTAAIDPGTYPTGLKARFDGDDGWYGSTATASVTIQPTCYPAAITTQPSGSTINLGSSASLSIATTGTAPVSVQWYTAAGVPVANGNNITVTPTWTTAYYAMVSNGCRSVQSTTVTVVVRQPATITWPAPAAITYGAALSAAQLNATANTPGSFTYSPAAGTVLGAGTRSLSVSFAPNDTANYLATTASNSIVVQKATPAISWPAPAAITYGAALSATQLNATAGIAGTFTYSPATGTILGAGTRTLSVTFTPADTANYNSVTVNNTLTVQKASPTGSWPAPAAIVYGTALSSTQLNGQVDIPGTYVYTPPAGTILGAGVRTLSCTFTPTDTANYLVVTGTVQITVLKATPAVTWSQPAAVTYGTALGAAQLNATANVAGSFAYSPAAGTVPAAGTLTLSATFTPTDAANYNGASGSVGLTVNKAAQTIVWPQPASIPSNTPLSATQLNATVSVPGPAAGGAITYDAAIGTVFAVGDHTVTATAAATANYNAATKSVVIKVCDPPVITTQPQSVITGPGAGVHLTLQATGTAPLTTSWYTSNGTFVANGNPYVAVSSTTSYYAIVSNACGSVQSATMTITVCTPPSIATQPAASTIAQGQSAVLHIGVTPLTQEQTQGGGAYTIQWYGSNNAIVGTGNDLSVSPVQTYSYYAIVGNGCGNTRSADVTVTVTPAPCPLPWFRTQSGGEMTIGSGNSATLSVDAASLSELNYQWYDGTTNFRGTPVGVNDYQYTTPIFELPEGSQFSEIHRYWVVVSNHCGSITSEYYDVTVSPVITIGEEP